MNQTQEAVLRQALSDICAARLCEINSMSSRGEMERLMDKAATALRAVLEELSRNPQVNHAWVNPASAAAPAEGSGASKIAVDRSLLESVSGAATRTELNDEPLKYGCHCDLDDNEQPDECFIDTGKPEDCVHAGILLREGKDKTSCKEWRPIQVVRRADSKAAEPKAEASHEKGSERAMHCARQGQAVMSRPPEQEELRAVVHLEVCPPLTAFDVEQSIGYRMPPHTMEMLLKLIRDREQAIDAARVDALEQLDVLQECCMPDDLVRAHELRQRMKAERGE